MYASHERSSFLVSLPLSICSSAEGRSPLSLSTLRAQHWISLGKTALFSNDSLIRLAEEAPVSNDGLAGLEGLTVQEWCVALGRTDGRTTPNHDTREGAFTGPAEHQQQCGVRPYEQDAGRQADQHAGQRP
jgi:hypothetical protein